MKNSNEERKIKEYLAEYNLPLIVKKTSWWGDFCFSVEKVSNNVAYGKRLKSGVFYDDFTCSINESYLLYGKNEKIVKENSSSLPFVKKVEPNPNNLELDKSKYISGRTTLFVKDGFKNKKVIFLRFAIKNGKDVIYVKKDKKTLFYAFPNTTYLFPNKDDVENAISKENRQNTNNKLILSILSTFNKLPKATEVSNSKDDENKKEKAYHKNVDNELKIKLQEPKNRLAKAENDEKYAEQEYVEAIRNARENGDVLDSFSQSSHYITLQTIQPRIQSAQAEINIINGIISKPYFARIDCGSNINDLHTAYIGDKDIPGYVVDWRNPDVGNAYYQSAFLMNKDGILLVLKRLIEIQHGVYKKYKDEINLYDSNKDIKNDMKKATDDFLNELLQQSRLDKKTHDIIKTIQSEQYEIITSNFEQNAVVNGCAGSGKTMIMYHRLSYIAYNYEGKTGGNFNPENIYVITPSAYFNMNNMDLLEKLSLNKINHMQFSELIDEFIRLYSVKYKIAPLNYLIELSNFNDNNECCDFYSESTYNKFICQLEEIDKNERIKNSYIEWALNLVNKILIDMGFERLNITNNELGNVVDILYSDKYYRNRCFIKNDSPSADLENKYYQKFAICDFSYQNIIASLNKMDKTKPTYKKRKKRLDKSTPIFKSCLSLKTLMNDYGGVETNINKFWNIFEKPEIFKKMLALINVENILNSIKDNGFSKKDYLLRGVFVASNMFSGSNLRSLPLYFLNALTRKYGSLIDEESFVFIDEFQNFSSFEIKVLKNVFSNPVFNLYGDYDQRLGRKGEDIKENLHALLSPNMYNLNINYRNAKQITEYINKIVNKNMQPIGVDGEVNVCKLNDCSFDIVDRTAIIVKDVELIKEVLLSYLKKDELNFIYESNDFDYKKYNVLSVDDSKGLEFDNVYVFIANMNDNEKYVSLTRALEKLTVIDDEVFEEVVRLKQKDRVKTKELPEKEIINKSDTVEAIKEKKYLDDNNIVIGEQFKPNSVECGYLIGQDNKEKNKRKKDKQEVEKLLKEREHLMCELKLNKGVFKTKKRREIEKEIIDLDVKIINKMYELLS